MYSLCGLDLSMLLGRGRYAWLYSGLGEALYRQSRLRMKSLLEAFRTGIDIYKSSGG